MDRDLIDPFIANTINVIQTMTGLSPVPGPIKKGAMSAMWGEASGMIGLAGDQLTGNMVLSFDDRSILAIVSRMFKEEIKEINADVVDAVGELTNVICGNVKRELDIRGLRFNMATPCMIRGKNVELSWRRTVPTVVIPFSMESGGKSAGQFALEVTLAPTVNGGKGG